MVVDVPIVFIQITIFELIVYLYATLLRLLLIEANRYIQHVQPYTDCVSVLHQLLIRFHSDHDHVLILPDYRSTECFSRRWYVKPKGILYKS